MVGVGAVLAFGVAGGSLAPEPASAAGSGHVALNGGGTVLARGNVLSYGVLRGKHRVVVVDRRGDAAITINGAPRKGRKRRGSRIRVFRTNLRNGRLYVHGRSVTVKITGPRVNLAVAGWGRLRLSGNGLYALNAGSRKSWRTATGKPRTIKVRSSNGR